MEEKRLKKFATGEILSKYKKVFVSQLDKDFYNLPKSYVIPNHITRFNFTKKYPPSFDFVFSGNFNYQPNIDAINWFLRNI